MPDPLYSKLTGQRLPWDNASGGKGSDSGEPPDDMKDRIEKLEAGHATIIEKLGEISAALKVIDVKLDAKASAETVERIGGDTRVALSDVRGILIQKASATDLAKVQGGLDRMPGTFTLILSLAGFAVTIFVAAGVAKHFGW